MRMRINLFILLMIIISAGLYSQNQQEAKIWGDGEAARQYVKWAQKEIDEGRWNEALAGLERAADFANVSSDVSYLLALCRSHFNKSRYSVLEALEKAIDINRWVSYGKNQALILKAEQLVVMRQYTAALSVLEQTGENADTALLRLRSFKALAQNGDINALARFRSLVLNAFDRYPRDPRPLRVFFEYARNRQPKDSDLSDGDISLLELAFRRLPFLLEDDPDLAWMAAPFMRDSEAARRLVMSYRAGGLSNRKKYSLNLPDSIPAALNLGLISDIDAVEELFGALNDDSFLKKNLVNDVYDLLRSGEGRDLFTRKLLTYSGAVYADDDRDGINESRVFYSSGVIVEYFYDINQADFDDWNVQFSSDGSPVHAVLADAGQSSKTFLDWERYPSVGQLAADNDTFLFRPADFQFAPIKFIELGGSQKLSGLFFPVLSDQRMLLTRRVLITSCASLSRPSAELPGATETIFLERGVLLRAIEEKNGKEVSVTEFERGLPVIQHIDLDLDGRMETIRRFRRPPNDYLWADHLDYRRLVASSESDWSGDGKYKTMEMYRPDGSVVYSWDMDGSGVINYSEQEDGNKK